MTEENTPDPVDETPAETPAAPDNEAAKYRRRLREAEQERDAAREHVRELQQAVIGYEASGRLTDPSVLANFVEHESLLGEDGKIDRDKITGALDALLEKHPGLGPQKATPRTRPQPRQGVPAGSGAPQERSKLEAAFPVGTTRWSDVMHKGERASATETARKSATVQVSSDPGQ